MQPRKDYEDYARFINDTYRDKKIDILLNKTDRKYSSVTKKHDFKTINQPLRIYSELGNKVSP